VLVAVECRSSYMIRMRKTGWREKRRRLTVRDAGDVEGSIPLERTTGGTPKVSHRWFSRRSGVWRSSNGPRELNMLRWEAANGR
jgi:hypothetical protein